MAAFDASSTGAGAAGAAAYCRGCGYALRGLAGGRCPECGRAFDLADRRSTARRPPRARLRWWAWRVALLLAVAALAIGSVPAWYWWQWRAEQRVIAEIRGMGGFVGVERADAEGLATLLPARWAFLRDHATAVEVDGLTAGQIGQLDLRPLRHVEKLIARNCGIHDAALDRFRGFRNIEWLILDDNPLDGSGLVHLTQCPRLKLLHLSGTRLNDAGLAHVARLTSIEVLSLNGTNVTDAGMAHLAGLASLKTLEIGCPAITDAGLVHLRGLTSLRGIVIAKIKVTEQGQRDLQRFLPQVTFYP